MTALKMAELISRLNSYGVRSKTLSDWFNIPLKTIKEVTKETP